MRIDIQMLLDSFEAPAVFYRENTVRYFNEAAKILFPDIREGKGMPERFNDSDFPFRAEINRTERGILYVFRPRLAERAGGDLGAVSEELRRCLASLTLTVGEMIPLVRECGGDPTGRIAGSADRTLHRLRRLTQHSDILRQMESGSPGVYRESLLDLADLCREMGDHVAEAAGAAGLSFRVDLRENCLPMMGDAELLKRMILNLVSNAIKAVRENGGGLGLRLERQEDRAIITVWDEGGGMEEERLAAIFRPQRRHKLNRPEEGAGLGLRLARETALLHGGRILAEARPEGGVTMKVALPLCPVKGEKLRSAAAWGEGGFDLVLEELSDVLPARLYGVEPEEE